MKSIKEMLTTHSLYTVTTGSNIFDVASYMAGHNIGLVPVLGEGGKLLGVFSERDLVRRVISKRLDLQTTKVDEVITKDLVLAEVNETYEECLKKMKDRG